MALFGKFFGGKEGEERPKRGRLPRKEDAQPEEDAPQKPPTSSAKPAAKKPSTSKRIKRPSTVKRSKKNRKSRSTTVIPRDAGQAKAPSGRFTPATESTEGHKRRTSMPTKRLGQLLIKSQAITENHLEEALEQQQAEGGLIGQILCRREFCDKAAIGGALRKQRTITTVYLESVDVDPEALALLERDFCEKNRLFPFEKMGNQLCVAMVNVLDAQAKKDMRESTSLQIKTFDASWQDIQSAIDKHYEAAPAPVELDADAVEVIEEDTAGDEDLVIELPDEEIEYIEEIASPQTAAEEDDTVAEALHPEPAVEIIEEPEPAPEPEPQPAAAAPAPRQPAPQAAKPTNGVLPAIPMSQSYFERVIQNGRADADRRWLAEHLAEEPLPVDPAPDLLT